MDKVQGDKYVVVYKDYNYNDQTEVVYAEDIDTAMNRAKELYGKNMVNSYMSITNESIIQRRKEEKQNRDKEVN